MQVSLCYGLFTVRGTERLEGHGEHDGFGSYDMKNIARVL